MKKRLLCVVLLAVLAFSALGILAADMSQVLLGILVLGLLLVAGLYAAIFWHPGVTHD